MDKHMCDECHSKKVIFYNEDEDGNKWYICKKCHKVF